MQQPLTEHQKRIIQQMKEGKILNVTGDADIFLAWKEQCELRELGLIEIDLPNNPLNYRLTKLGKRIKID